MGDEGGARWADRHTFLVILAGLPPLGPPERLDFYIFFGKMIRITLSLLLSFLKTSRLEDLVRRKETAKRCDDDDDDDDGIDNFSV